MADPGALAAVLPVVPAVAFAAIGLPALVGAPLPERAVVRIATVATGVTWGVAVAMAALVAMSGARSFELGLWYAVQGEPVAVELLADAPGATLAVLTATLVAIVARFSDTYLHREPGFLRFFALLLLFEAGLLQVCVAGSLDLLFFGWETIGLCSALLIGFFHDRAGPVASGLRAFVTYRACDLGILVAAALLDHAAGSSRFDVDPGSAATAAGLLVLVGAMGKSAQVPVSGWLFRAMEGPTPSSALFYGGLSLHAGVFLLIRAGSWLDASPIAAGATVAVGAATALIATACARVAPDAKGALAWAAVAQTGLMFVEVGLGWHTLALAHLAGHACLRTWQLLRAPSALRDDQRLTAALGHRRVGARFPALYALALHGFHLDALVWWAVRPVLGVARRLDAWERRADRWLGGES